MKPNVNHMVGLAGALALAFSLGRVSAPTALLAQTHSQILPPREGSYAPEAPEVSQNGSAFTYQGQLKKNGAPVNASCNASFKLYDAATGGVQIGGTVTSATLQVSNGLFTVPLDFGWNFNGEARWLQTEIGCGEAQQVLSPRTALRPAPYAFALPGMRTVPGNPASGQPTMNVIGGVVTGTVSNAINANSFHSVIAGGVSNRIDGASEHSAIGGGSSNVIDTGSDYSAIDGGYDNRILNNSTNSAVGSGGSNYVQGGSAYSAIGGGYGNRVDGLSFYGAIGGGYTNLINVSSPDSAIGGGESNRIGQTSSHSVIAGGNLNIITRTGGYGAIGGGQGNSIGFTSTHSAIAGGNLNVITRTSGYGAIGGGGRNRIDNLSDYGVVNGGYDNLIDSYSGQSAIGGGESNRIQVWADHGVVGGGYNNVIVGLDISNRSPRNVIGGGESNRIDRADNSVIGGGETNAITQTASGVIGGGERNGIGGSTFGTIAGGSQNVIFNSAHAAIGGGANNVIWNGFAGIIPGGGGNQVRAQYSFAAGAASRALHEGSFVWSDYSNIAYGASTSAPNQFVVRAAGGITMYTNSGQTTGVQVAAGGGSWTSVSDRNLKANIVSVNPQSVLDKVAALPISTWNYTSQDARVRHIGPMAQDFHAAFGVGETDTGITTVDADGVALAAIQGLKAENDALKTRLAAIEATLDSAGDERSAPPLAAPVWAVLGLLVGLSVVGLARKKV